MHAGHAHRRKDDGTLRVERPERRALPPLAARAHPDADREHGRGRDEGLREAAGDRGRRLPGRDEGRATSSSRSGSPTRCSSPRPRDRVRGAAPTRITIRGIDKQLVGEIAANIRKIRKPEPYKGKGIRYEGEYVRKKAGKAAKGERVMDAADEARRPRPPPRPRPQARSRARAERPRLAVYRSNRHIYAQLVDDAPRARSRRRPTPGSRRRRARPTRAKAVGELLADARKAAGIERAVFDRGGRLYHGRVAAAGRRARAREAWRSDATVRRQRRSSGARSRSAWSRSTAWPRSSRAAGGSRSPRSSSSATAPAVSASATARPRRSPRRSRRASRRPKKNMFEVPLMGTTIPHEVDRRGRRRRGAAEAGRAGHRRHRRRPVRAVVECAGIKDILSKSLGSSNPINIVHATVAGLQMLRRPEEIAAPAGPRASTTSRRGRCSRPWPRPRPRREARQRRGAGAMPGRGARRSSMAKLKVTQLRSVIDRPKDQKDTVRRLGLHRINDSVVKDDRPEIRGMIAKVRHLVRVEEVERNEAPSSAARPRARSATRKRVGRGRAGRAGQDRRPRHQGLGGPPSARRRGFEGGQMPLQRRRAQAEGVHQPQPGRVRRSSTWSASARHFDAGRGRRPTRSASAGSCARGVPVKVLARGELEPRPDRPGPRGLGGRQGEDRSGGRAPGDRSSTRMDPGTTEAPPVLKAFVNAFKIPDLRKKILFTLFIIAVFRFGSHVPVPGHRRPGAHRARRTPTRAQAGFLQFIDLFSGGALTRFAVFSLGIMPYITSSIIMQLLTVVIPKLEQWQKQGEVGHQEDHPVDALHDGDAGAAAVHRPGVPVQQRSSTAGPGHHPGRQVDAAHVLLIVLTLTAGTAMIMWLGELITQRGIGNGMSILIFTSVISRLPAEGDGDPPARRGRQVHRLPAARASASSWRWCSWSRASAGSRCSTRNASSGGG